MQPATPHQRVCQLVDRLLDHAQALQSHPGIEVTRFDWDPEGLDDDQLDALEEEVGLGLGEATRAFWSRLYYFQLDWQAREVEHPRGVPLSGSIGIEGPHLCLGGPEGTGWKGTFWSDHTPPERVPNLAAIRPFDQFYPDDRGCTCLHFVDGVESPTLALYQAGLGSTTVHGLGIGLERYLELLVETRGAEGFQYTIAPTPLHLDHAAYRESLRSALSQLFGDVRLDWMR